MLDFNSKILPQYPLTVCNSLGTKHANQVLLPARCCKQDKEEFLSNRGNSFKIHCLILKYLVKISVEASFCTIMLMTISKLGHWIVSVCAIMLMTITKLGHWIVSVCAIMLMTISKLGHWIVSVCTSMLMVISKLGNLLASVCKLIKLGLFSCGQRG